MKTVMKIFILLLLATPVFSANTWTGAGANNLWTNTSNWSGGYPDTTNQLKLQGNNEILEVVSGNVILFNRAVFIDGTSVAGGLDNTTTTINMTGGSLTCTTTFRVGYFGSTSTSPTEGAVLNMSGDSYFQTGTFELGFRSYSLININITDNARLYVTGTAPGLLFPGVSTALDVMARINISGNGKLELNSLAMTIGQDGIINISGDGVLKVKGNVAASVVNPLIAANMITTDSGSTTPTTLYDGTWTWVMSPNNSSLAKPNTPSPASGATVYTITDLTWLPGSPTHTWDLYLGTDANNLSLVASGLTTPEYKMACLDFQKKYYWKVNEFNGSSTISGDVWNFTTYDYTKLFWFEYANQAALDSEWTPANSQIAVSTNPARGAASLAMTYNNTASPYISRAVTTAVPYNGNFACTSGVALSVWVYGNPANGNDPVYASISDGTNTATTVCTISGITQAASWTIWNIDVREFTANNPNVDMTKITSVTLGVGNPISPAAGGSGTVYFDNVNLYPVRCLNKPAADTNGDCVINFKDFAEMAAEWLSSGLFPVF